MPCQSRLGKCYVRCSSLLPQITCSQNIAPTPTPSLQRVWIKVIRFIIIMMFYVTIRIKKNYGPCTVRTDFLRNSSNIVVMIEALSDHVNRCNVHWWDSARGGGGYRHVHVHVP